MGNEKNKSCEKQTGVMNDDIWCNERIIWCDERWQGHRGKVCVCVCGGGGAEVLGDDATDETAEKYIYIYIIVIAFINLVSENNRKTTTNGPGFQTTSFLWLW